MLPYNRGKNPNVWPIIDGTPAGVTLHYIDSGIDTGEIIHQIRAKYSWGDSPSQIGNRLISQMTIIYRELIIRFDDLMKMKQISKPHIIRLYKNKLILIY